MVQKPDPGDGTEFCSSFRFVFWDVTLTVPWANWDGQPAGHLCWFTDSLILHM